MGFDIHKMISHSRFVKALCCFLRHIRIYANCSTLFLALLHGKYTLFGGNPWPVIQTLLVLMLTIDQQCRHCSSNLSLSLPDRITYLVDLE